MAIPTYWTGPLEDRCQISGRKLDGVMYDAKIPGGGWANVAHQTFVNLGCSLGVGYGQKFEKQPDGRWLCTAGSAAHAVTLSLEDQAQIKAEAKARKGE